MEMVGDYPDIVIDCAGGGSNFARIALPFIGEQLRESQRVRAIAIEPGASLSMTRSHYAYDFGDTVNLTPLTKIYTLCSSFVTSGFHAGGLCYLGMSPLMSHAKKLGLLEAVGYHQTACFETAITFARSKVIIPAPETSYAVKGAIEEAMRCKREGKAETILFNLSDHGHFDMAAYTEHFSGKLEDKTMMSKY